MDESAISRALKQLDGRLILQKHARDRVDGGWVYKVLYNWSDSHPPRIVLTWMDDHGTPLPLSSGLIDLTQRHMLGARNTGPDADEYNLLHEQQAERDAAAARGEVIADHQARLAGRTSVSLAHRRRRPGFLKQHRGRLR